VTLAPQLFTILDSFDEWTEAHGLSLTIDYHQYDRSLDFADPATQADAVELWRQVAQHFAARPRLDLFFELLNEPALSVEGTSPTANQWTTLAERMITAIRATDTVHTIVFGDVDWYDIDPLSRRTPLSDANIVYAFHFYEPFIFTHQGASWATGMSSVHDVPYPYSEARWSEHSADFGFTSLNQAWQLQQLRDYYQIGNATALRNRIAEAKSWAVTNNVPVICNEFGAYDANSRMEDRVRYYTDLRTIFNELAIPWQIWFMIMDAKTGSVDPEYQTALGLGN
jgi:endoglucanase